MHKVDSIKTELENLLKLYGPGDGLPYNAKRAFQKAINRVWGIEYPQTSYSVISIKDKDFSIVTGDHQVV